jgi:hypothetical protein
VALRSRRHPHTAKQPIAFPAWRTWEDRRLRTDNGVLALFAAARIAAVAVDDRSGDAAQFVSELYTDDELRFRSAFAVSVADAKLRWQAGIEDLSQMAIVSAIAATDDLLGATIRLLRATGHDASPSGSTDTGVSAKLRHLSRHGCQGIDADTLALHSLLVEIRHVVPHYGARQKPAADAWRRLSSDARERWIAAAGRPLPLTQEDSELRLDDRELLAALKTLDQVALEVAQSLRQTVSEPEWANLVVAEYRQMDLSKANDPNSNLHRIKKHASAAWRFPISDKIAIAALDQPTEAKLLPALPRPLAQ